MTTAIAPSGLVDWYESCAINDYGDSELYERSRQGIDHTMLPAHRQVESLLDKFRRLSKRWKEETGFYSSLAQISSHPSYQQIVGMGPEVVPILLSALVQRPDHWFVALHHITGANPVLESSRGNIRRMADDWIKWGRAQGYKIYDFTIG